MARDFGTSADRLPGVAIPTINLRCAAVGTGMTRLWYLTCATSAMPDRRWNASANDWRRNKPTTPTRSLHSKPQATRRRSRGCGRSSLKIENAIQDVDNGAANIRSGYVISNLGSLGEDMIKVA